MGFITAHVLISGLSLGSIYTIVALGLAFIYKCTGILNFAHGFLALIGGYFLMATVRMGLTLWIAIPATLAFAALLGYMIQRGIMRPLLGKGILPAVMVTIVLGFALEALVRLIWGGGTQVFPTFLPEGSFHGISLVDVSIILVAGGLTALFFLFFRKTRLGIRLRALADDQKQITAIRGDIHRLLRIVWMIGVLLAVIGGILFVHTVPLSPAIVMIGIVVFPVIILGGLDSISGAIVGGLTIGLAQSIIAFNFAHVIVGIKVMTPQFIALAVLLVLPYGLFGEEIIERV